MRCYSTPMAGEKNQLLEYTIDTLLKTFNPDRKPIMKRAHFYKMMDIVDTKLKKQKIDIRYPSYWYRYGSVTDFAYLDQVIPKGFSGRYFDGEHIFFPSSHRRTYDIDPHKRAIINSTIELTCDKYRYKSDYGKLLKKDSYELNSPYKFNTIFQDYIEIVSNTTQSTLFPKEEILESLLNRLLGEFPEEDFPEALDIYLSWDDTTRLVLDDYNESKDQLLALLMDLFWGVYSKGIKSIYNKYFTADHVIIWKQEYEQSLPIEEKKIEGLRKEILVKRNRDFNLDEDLVKKLMNAAYNLSV